MRRVLAVTLSLAVGLSTAAFTLAGGSAAAEGEVPAQPTIAPPSGQTRVGNGALITFGGTADPAATLLEGRMLSLLPGASCEELDPEAIDHAYVLRGLSISNGQFTGSTTYPGPETMAAHDGKVFLEVFLDVNGVEQRACSNGIRIDLVEPYIVGSSLVSLVDPSTGQRGNHVRVEFSEPVRMTDPTADSDLAVDWRVNDVPPTSVGRPEDRSLRYLYVTHADQSLTLDQDATPSVQLPSHPLIGLGEIPKHWYRDEAGWRLSFIVNRTTIAVDRVAPVKPVLTHVAGEANDGVAQIVKNDPTPSFQLTGLREGHVGQVYLESNDTEGFQADGDALIGEAVADEDGKATVEAADALEDGNHSFYGVARDRAKCTPSDGNSPECPNYSGGAPAFYKLDTVAPTALFAQTTLRGGQLTDPVIKVRFSEVIVPDAGNAADWTVGGSTVEAVTGVDDERTLDLSAPVLGGTPVAWTQPGEGGVRYADKAGNELQSMALNALDGIPPLVTMDTDLSGAAPMFRRTGNCQASDSDRVCFVLTGDVTNATHLNILGAPDGEILYQLPGGQTDTRFLVQVNLLPNARNDVRIEPLRLDPNAANPEIRGPIVNVRPIVHDNIAPVVNVADMGRVLADGKLGFKGNETAPIQWTAADANLVTGPIKLDVSFDDGATWENIADGKSNTSGDAGSFNWTTPALSTEKALVRMTATDQVGLRSSDASNQFVIDAKPPTFQTSTVDATHVRVLFSEGVQLQDNPAQDWLIYEPVGGEQVGVPASEIVVVQADTNGLVKEMLLQTGVVPNSAPPIQQQISPNETPDVEYRPIDQDQQLVEQLRDRADNLLSDRVKTASDRIAPLAPTEVQARRLIRERTEPIQGTAETTAGNDVMVRRVSPGATFADDVNDGVFNVQVGLALNRDNSYRLWIQDPAGNVSPDFTLKIENDQIRPRITVRRPRVGRSGGKTYARLRWRTVEAHKGTVTIKFRMDGRWVKSKGLRTLVTGTPDDGSFRWRVPGKWRGRQFQFVIRSIDRVGNARTDRGGWIRVR